jgi:hypothetical protein
MFTKYKRLPKKEKIFDIYTSDNGLISRIYILLKKLNSKKNQWPNEDMGKWIESFFSVEEIKMVEKHKKNCSTFLAIKEM